MQITKKEFDMIEKISNLTGSDYGTKELNDKYYIDEKYTLNVIDELFSYYNELKDNYYQLKYNKTEDGEKEYGE